MSYSFWRPPTLAPGGASPPSYATDLNMNLRKLRCAHKRDLGRPAYSPVLYQIKSTKEIIIPKLLVMYRCQVEILEGRTDETA